MEKEIFEQKEENTDLTIDEYGNVRVVPIEEEVPNIMTQWFENEVMVN